jgi:hypothetical protein
MFGKFEFYGAPDIDQELTERTVSVDAAAEKIRKNAKGVPGSHIVVLNWGKDGSLRAQTHTGRMIAAFSGVQWAMNDVRQIVKKLTGPKPGHGAIEKVTLSGTGIAGQNKVKGLWKAEDLSVVGRQSQSMEEGQRMDWDTIITEARSKKVGKGKYKYKGKVGVWRTLKSGDKVFFPDDKSGPMAMQGPKKKGALSKIAGGIKKVAGAIKRKLTREELEAELAALESTNSPYPEIRARRIEELKAELAEAVARYELVYQTGGHGGPYKGEAKAKAAAERLLKGGRDRWIAVVDAKDITDLRKAKALWLLRRGKGWEKGPQPLPNIPAREHYKETAGSLGEGRKARKWIRVNAILMKKGAAKKEELEAEIERLEATSSPFPEVRERRIAELKQSMQEEAEELVERRQKLMTAKIRRDLPELYSQENVEDPMVYAKFFYPYGAGTWLATEFDGKDTFFGAVKGQEGWSLGYFSLREMESVKGPMGAQGIERDAHFRPMVLSKAKKA